MSLRTILEDAVAQERFSGPAALYEVVRPVIAADPGLSLIGEVERRLGKQLASHVTPALFRMAFLIEWVKSGAKATKIDVRWASVLPPSDLRHATYETCLEILQQATVQILALASSSPERHMLDRLRRSRMVAYELPIDYQERRISAPIHTPDNVTWIFDDPDVVRAIALRGAVQDPTVVGSEHKTFKAALKKIKVKTYLTDRAQTGAYKTNREKRWEAHPSSPQFATRRACLGVEAELIEGICFLDSFPLEIRQRLLDSGVIRLRGDVTRCPITLEPLSFAELKQELLDPTHGKASFQVGHLNPLKAVNGDATFRHTARNIAWISEDGNRIQGSLSLAATRKMLHEIAARYALTNWSITD